MTLRVIEEKCAGKTWYHVWLGDKLLARHRSKSAVRLWVALRRASEAALVAAAAAATML